MATHALHLDLFSRLLEDMPNWKTIIVKFLALTVIALLKKLTTCIKNTRCRNTANTDENIDPVRELADVSVDVGTPGVLKKEV